jgi:hypothetical protein
LTTNRTEVNPGYNLCLQFSPSGKINVAADETWEGKPIKKNDIIVDFNGVAMNLTGDGTEPLTAFFR